MADRWDKRNGEENPIKNPQQFENALISDNPDELKNARRYLDNLAFRIRDNIDEVKEAHLSIKYLKILENKQGLDVSACFSKKENINYFENQIKEALEVLFSKKEETSEFLKMKKVFLENYLLFLMEYRKTSLCRMKIMTEEFKQTEEALNTLSGESVNE